jgi:hypothetical protein
MTEISIENEMAVNSQQSKCGGARKKIIINNNNNNNNGVDAIMCLCRVAIMTGVMKCCGLSWLYSCKLAAKAERS